MNSNSLCPHCLKEVENVGGCTLCPHCQKDMHNISEVQHQLKPQTILAGKYLVGDVIGEGGFGITYVGFDLNLEMRVAIKEFYPNGYATREANTTTALTVYSGSNQESVQKWREGFIKEARSLAKCSHLSGVVGVKDFFQENNTAYIILEYLEGVTLKNHIKEHGGKVSVDWLLSALGPVIVSLGELHKGGLIHRDISPDNIMLLPDGSMKLIDFGAARDYTESGEKSLSVMLKPGYAPEEQYRSKGIQGPWSDIYAIAGTIYRCITGITPIESMERIRKDELKKPSELGIVIDKTVEAALMKGFAVFAEERYQNIEEFHKDLYESSLLKRAVGEEQTKVDSENKVQRFEVPENKNANEDVDNIVNKTKKRKLRIAIVAGLVACIVIGLLIGIGLKNKKKNSMVADEDVTTEAMSEKVTEVIVESQQEEELIAVSQEQPQNETYNEVGIHQYELIVEDVSWSEAYDKCLQSGGYLVRINSDDECMAILQQIEQEGLGNIKFWVGGARNEDEYDYYWVYGDNCAAGNVSINNDTMYEDYWLEGEPSYYDKTTEKQENRMNMFYMKSLDKWVFNDVPDDIISVANFYSGNTGYICEYE